MVNSFFCQHQFKSESIILTPNQRLASFALQQLTLLEKKNELSQTNVNVFTFKEWLQECWNKLTEQNLLQPFTLLSEQQLLSVWEKTLQSSATNYQLIQIAATAETALEAWKLAHAWQINCDNPIFALNEDTATWQQWYKLIIKQYQAHQWVDSSMLGNIILPLLEKTPCPIALPKEVILIGFNTYTPQEQSVLSALQKHNCSLIYVQLKQTVKRQVRIACDNTEMELRTAAQWAKSHSQETKVACVIPNLNEIRDEAIHIFSDYFLPKEINISLGKRFNRYPLIKHALIILELLLSEISLFDFSSLLRSPFLAGSEQELSLRANLDIHLRNYYEPTINTALLIKQLYRNNTCPIFISCLRNFMKPKLEAGLQQSASAWCEYFQQQLSVFRWPGERFLTVEEFQLKARWESLLTEFSSLSIVIPKFTLNQALYHLQQLASRTIFQFESDPDVRIHILGMFEAAGLVFDKLWVMGLHDNAWPASALPNPFLPTKLQREAKMPHASAEQELLFSQRITTQLSQAAEEIIFSFSEIRDNVAARPSSLISPFPEIKLEDLAIPPILTLAEQLLGTAEMESIYDEFGSKLPIGQEKYRSSSIFKEQAACPFRAFVHLRLGAKGFADPKLGLTALLRGNIIHKIMENIWQQLESHTKLCSYDEASLRELVTKSINQILSQTKHYYTQDAWHKAFFILEEKRLTGLILRWLALEKTRTPFTVIATEKEFETQLGNLPLHLRIDRIDQLEDGTYVIVDYKTSDCSVNDWLSERPDEPQLPLYYVINDLPISGLSFAQMKQDSLGFKGYTVQQNILPGSQAIVDFTTLKETWENTLQQLATDYLSGHAKINPKDMNKTCRLCDLQMVCRINELQLIK